MLPLLSLAQSDDVQQVGMAEILAGCGLAKIETERGTVALALMRRGVELWIQAAGGEGQGMTGPGLEAVEQLARQYGMQSVGFQTRRPGLVRRALRAGYVIDGFILRKKC